MNEKTIHETIITQLSTFGYEHDESLNDAQNVIAFCNWINNVDKTPPIAQNVNHVDIQHVNLDDVSVIEKRVRMINAHAVPENGIAGIIIKINDRYHILDGYHRYKWLKENGYTEGFYIVVW